MTILIIIGLVLYSLFGGISAVMFSAQMFLTYNKVVTWPEPAEWLFLIYIWVLVSPLWPIMFGMLFLFEQSVVNPLTDMKSDCMLIVNHLFGKPLTMSSYWRKYII